jgi:hypothetical protein
LGAGVSADDLACAWIDDGRGDLAVGGDLEVGGGVVA